MLWLSEKFDPPPYNAWQLSLFGRSVIIVVCWLLTCWFITTTPQLIPTIFKSIRVENTGIRVFGTEVLRSGYNGVILSSYTWVMLATIVLFISHIWNSLCVETTTEDLGAVDSWNRVITKCYHGEQCYAIADASDLANLVGSWPSFGSLLKTTLWWDLDPVCDKLINLTPVEAEAAFLALSKAKQRQRATICHRLWPSGSWTVGVGNVAIGLAMMLTTRTLFEVATMLLLKRSRHRVFNMGVLVDVVIGILALLLAYDMVRNSFWGLSAASNDFACIVVLPVVLYQARRTARTIKMVRLNESDERLRKLQETQLGKEIDALAHGRETTQGTIDNEEGTTYTRAKGFISRLMNRVPKSP